jgi:ATP synthase protein I
MVRPLSNQAASQERSLPPSEPEDLKRLGERIDAAGKAHAEEAAKSTSNTPLGIAFRLGTELMAAVVVGSGLGLGIDWAFQHWAHIPTRPAGLVVMFLLGTAAGIRTVIRSAQQISADAAPKEK